MKTRRTRGQRIAHAMVSKITRHGQKKSCSKDAERTIRSVTTEGHYKFSIRHYLRWRKFMGLGLKGPYELFESAEYLDDLADSLEQKQLESARQSLVRVLKQELPPVKSRLQTILSARAYNLFEVQEIIKHQTDRNAICTTLCFVCGLRAHEALTLRRADEVPRSSNRPWSIELFAGIEDYVPYTVKGKGGLRRLVAIPRHLAELLELHRLPIPLRVKDREAIEEVAYAVGAGQAFSQSFSQASQEVMGFSFGAHGLRHSYAQRRIRTLRGLGFDVNKALKIVSEEMGHFRISVVWAYLR
jgi:integrase